MAYVFIIEDNEDLKEAVVSYLKLDGHTVMEFKEISGVMKSIDFMNSRIGSTKIRLASQSLGRTWKMRQERLSPQYTTNFNDIIKVR